MLSLLVLYAKFVFKKKLFLYFQCHFNQLHNQKAFQYRCSLPRKRFPSRWCVPGERLPCEMVGNVRRKYSSETFVGNVRWEIGNLTPNDRDTTLNDREILKDIGLITSRFSGE